MSKVGKRIIAGLNDAIAYINGDESKARVVSLGYPMLEIQTCPKCGAKAVAFICSEKGCPINCGAAYEEGTPPSRT